MFSRSECDGVHSGQSHLAISNWEVQLCSGNQVLETIMTDNFGYYSFNNVTPGDYTIKSINPSMAITSTPLIVNVSIGDNEVVSVDFGFCDVDVCCLDEETFLNEISEGLKVLTFDCDVFVKPIYDINQCYEIIIDWGDGTIENYSGDLFAEHTYIGDGEYTLCVRTIKRNSEGEICNEYEECRSLCMTCGVECEEDRLTNILALQGSNYNMKGYIVKHSDVFLDDSGMYSTYVSESASGQYNLLFFKDDQLVHSIQSDHVIQVSEIQIFNNEIYVTGSFERELLVTSASSNDTVNLFANCYTSTSCAPDAFVMKFDLGFNIIWAFRFGDFWIDAVEDITIIDQDEFAITGITRI
ncbi:MAG: SdrD B-like domain-containing protein [Saprospiraceae bacterium]